MTVLYYRTHRSGRRRAVRSLAGVAREEVRLACGILGSNPGGGGRFRNFFKKAAASGRRWMPPPYCVPAASGGGEALG